VLLYGLFVSFVYRIFSACGSANDIVFRSLMSFSVCMSVSVLSYRDKIDEILRKRVPQQLQEPY